MKFFLRNCFLPDPEERKYDRIHVGTLPFCSRAPLSLCRARSRLTATGACCPETRLKDLYALLKPRGILVVHLSFLPYSSHYFSRVCVSMPYSLQTPCGDKLIRCTKDLQGNVKVETISRSVQLFRTALNECVQLSD